MARHTNKGTRLGKLIRLILFIILIFFMVNLLQDKLSTNGQPHTEVKTTKLGFEDMGEFVTQAAFTSSINSVEKDKELFGLKIPFTQSKYIYSYDSVIKAGINFSDIGIAIDNSNKSIQLSLPKFRILDSKLDMDSFKVYYEKESIFTSITLSENNDSMKLLLDSATETAIENGILLNAEENAKQILSGFVSQAFDLKEYSLSFISQ